MLRGQAKAVEVAPRYSEFRYVVRVFFRRKLAVFGLALVIAMILMAIFAPFIAPHDPYLLKLENRLLQPNNEYLLGCDPYGRDLLTRVIYGSQVSLAVGLLAMSMACIIGSTLGLLAAYFGRTTHTIIMRITDAWMSIPPLALVVIIAALLGGGMVNVIISLGIGMVPLYMGASNLRMMVRHVLPNCLPVLIIITTVNLGIVILTEASLSFLGFGIQPPTASWGGSVSDGYKYLLSNPLLSIAPGFAIMLAVFGFNMMGDGLRDALDPRLRGTL
jgi:ABC-type dipeptide/oligopeptide/nickel transport system permease subunit